MHLTYRHFEMIETLVRCRTIGRAANLLGLSQPGMSRALKTLEEQIGGPLFEKSHTGLIPTTLAEIFMRNNRALQAPLEDIVVEIERMKGVNTGRLVIGAGLYAAAISVTRAVGEVHKRHPGLAIELIERDWRDITLDVLSGSIDLAIVDVSAAIKGADFDVEPLPHHKCLVMVREGHPLREMRTVKMRDLIKYPYCGTQPSSWVNALTTKHPEIFGAVEKKEAAVPVTVNSVEAVRAVVQSSDCFGILPRCVIPNAAAFRPLVELVIPELDWLRTNYGFVSRKNRPPSPAGKAFMAIVRDIEAEMAQRESNETRADVKPSSLTMAQTAP